MNKLITAGLTTLVMALFIGTTQAYAADAASYTIDFGPVIGLFADSFQNVILAAVGAFLTWALHRWGSFLGQSTQDTVRGYVMTAIENGVHKYASKLLVSGASWQQIHTSNELVSEVATYALAHVPDGLSKLGIDPAALASIVEAQIGKWVGANIEVTPVPVVASKPAA